MLCLIDVSHNFCRNYFGSGKSATMAYTLTMDEIARCRDDYERIVLCCDSRSKRHEFYPEYKAGREPLPEEAIDSLVSVAQQVESWGVPVLRCEGYEADDIIGTLCAQAFLDDVRILTQDKDLYQLIRDNVRLVTKRGEVTPEGCAEKFGVKPEQMRDWLALVGDTSDNIAGCPGVGPGRARDLLLRFGSIEGIMAASDDELRTVRLVGDKTINGLRNWDPSLAVRLVTLMTDAPVELEKLWTV